MAKKIKATTKAVLVGIALCLVMVIGAILIALRELIYPLNNALTVCGVILICVAMTAFLPTVLWVALGD